MRVVIKDDDRAVAEYVSEYVIQRIHSAAPTKEKPFVIGLPTGGTPVKTYERLIAAHKAGRVSFQNVVSFNMDEYVGLPRDHAESYWTFMHRNLFDHIDMQPGNINILDGNAEDLVDECERYERKIASLGGIELFLGGLGHDGHIAFNEPGSSLSSRTRVKSLNRETIVANARFFGGDMKKVPTMAVTVGIGTIMDAREVLFVVTGHAKALALRMCVEEGVSHMWTGSMLQLHKKCSVVVDDLATLELRVRTVRYFKDLQSTETELSVRQERARSAKREGEASPVPSPRPSPKRPRR